MSQKKFVKNISSRPVTIKDITTYGVELRPGIKTDLLEYSTIDKIAKSTNLSTAIDLGLIVVIDDKNKSTKRPKSRAKNFLETHPRDEPINDNSTTSGAPAPHAASHTNGTDDIQNATNTQKGLATPAQITVLEAALANVVEDTTPQLGGDIDLNSKNITAAGPTIISSTEVSYLDGVSSNIQTQLNTKLANVVEDTTPQLGGQLDVNGNSLVDGTRELLSFSETASAVNELTITNAASTGSPSLTATGDDTNIDLTLAGKGTGTIKLSSDMNANSNDMDNVLTLTYSNEYNNGSKNTTFALNWNNGQKQKVTLNGNTTMTFTNPLGPCNLLLKIIQDATGSRTITSWNVGNAVKWPGGTAPTLSTTGSAIDLVSFYFDGTNYYGVANLKFS